MVTVKLGVQVAGLLVTILSGTGALLRGIVDHPREDYQEKVKELQENRWNDVSAELGELFVKVQKEFSPGEVDGGPTLEAKYGMFIKSKHNRGLLDDLDDELRRLDEPRLVFEKCRKAYHYCLPLFIVGILISIPAIIVLVLDTGQVGLAIGLILIYISATSLVMALFLAYRYWSARQELDTMWEEYDLF